MQEYDTGHGNISETVSFPGYVYSMANFINRHANNSDTLILPLTYDMLSMKFSSSDIFSDDNYAGLLTGSPVFDGQNSSISNLIMLDMEIPNSNFSALLNNINVKYILINTIFDKYAHGYYSNTNITNELKYINNQTGLKLVKSFGPLLVYKNIYYNGIIEMKKVVSDNFSLFDSENYYSVLSDFKTINTTFNERLSNYKEFEYNYSSSGFNLTMPSETSKLLNYGFYFSNNKSLNINISNYHYLIITAKSKDGNELNGAYFGIHTLTYLDNLSSESSYITPLNSATNQQGKSTNVTYIYPLFSNQPDVNTAYYNLSSGAGNILNSINIAMLFHSNSTFPSFVNISKIGFAKSLNSFGELAYCNELISGIPANNSEAKIAFKEINPTLYEVDIKNASSAVEFALEQNFNPNWRIVGIPKNLTEHFIANYIENGWKINKTGNYTFYIEFIPQKTYNEINSIALSDNLVAVALVAILIFRRKKTNE